jgi:multidrug efflux system membrane fusion protein
VPATQQFDPSSGAKGSLFFIDNSVDTATGTVMLKATFPNQPATLWAGEFVSTALLLFTERNALVVPATAVLTGQQGTYVYVIDSTRTARQRPVTVERTAGEVTVIASGVKDGEEVVVDGQSRLTPGARVTITKGEARAGARNGAAESAAPHGSSNATAPAAATPVPASPAPATPVPSTRPGGRP